MNVEGWSFTRLRRPKRSAGSSAFDNIAASGARIVSKGFTRPGRENKCGRGLCPGQGLGRHRPRTYNYSVDKERRRAYTRAYYEENRDKELERARRYRQENPDVIRQASLRRRIKKLGVGDSHTVAQWHALCAEYDHRCLGCGGTDKPLTRDHIIPLSLGGTDYIDNLQPLCLSL